MRTKLYISVPGACCAPINTGASLMGIPLLQYFWFRHIFLMTPQQAKRCQDVVLELIKDRKLEIQEAAANTLAGMIKGLSEEAFQKLQNELLARLDELVPKKAQRGRRLEAAGLRPLRTVILICFDA